jgi:intracellular septation protein
MLEKEQNSLVKSFLEIIPLILFFIGNAYDGIIFATKIFVIATVASLIISYFYFKKISTTLILTTCLVLVFGSLTIFFDDPIFIKLKPTIVYMLFSFFLFFGLIVKKNFLKIYLSSLIKINDEGWKKLSIRWGIFFIMMAILNEIIWRNFSTDFWVSFKVFGFIPLTIIFTITQQNLIKRHSIK